MNINESKSDSKEKNQNLMSKRNNKGQLNLNKNVKFSNNNMLEYKSKKTNLNPLTPRRMKARPILFNNINQNNKNDDIKKKENENFSNLLLNKERKSKANKKLNKIFLRNNSSMAYGQLIKNSKTIDYQNINIKKPIITNNLKKSNLLFNKRMPNINRAKSNINSNKKNFSTDNLSLSNDSKKKINTANNNKTIDKDLQKLNKKILSSKSKSSQSIFISNLDIRSARNSGKVRSPKNKNYRKKWNLPKIIRFDKITGRYKENKNPIKFQAFERMYDYSPNYELLSFNDKKAYVRLGAEKKMKFKNYKINITRKYLCNHRNIINNSGDFYNILKIIKEEKEKRDKIKTQLEKKFNIEEEYNYYKKNKYFTIDLEKKL